MSVLEQVEWGYKPVSILQMSKVIQAPHYCAEPSAIASPDSGFGSTPVGCRSLSSLSDLSSPRPLPSFFSRRLFTCGGPGFTLGIINCENGDVEQLSVPMAKQILDSTLDVTTFTLSTILSMSLVGENQLWAGTDQGTLHCFDLLSDIRLKHQRLTQHSFVHINEPILCIASRPLDFIFPPATDPASSLPLTPPTTEIIIGIPYGYIVILSGLSDERGRLKDPLEKLSTRRIVRFSNTPTNCEVTCIAHVYSSNTEMYWCACGESIIVLRSSDWKQLKQISLRKKLPNGAMLEGVSHQVTQLVCSDVGVWSSISRSATVTLWDKTNFSPKTHITYCDYHVHHTSPIRPEVSFLHYLHPLLLLGTQQGQLIIFKMSEKRTSLHGTTTPTSQKDHWFITSHDFGNKPIIGIYTSTPMGGGSVNVLGTPLCSPASSLVSIVLVCGTGESEGGLYHFELQLPPYGGGSLNSPTSSWSGSTIRSTNSITPRKLSIVSSNGTDFLPLKSVTPAQS